MTTSFVDANVILRFLTGTPEEMANRAAGLFARIDRGEEQLVVPEIIVGEVVWTLESYYRRSRQEIARTIRSLLGHEGITLPAKDTVLYALSLYETKGVNFADALLAAHASHAGIERVYSFDRHLDRIEEIVRQEP